MSESMDTATQHLALLILDVQEAFTNAITNADSFIPRVCLAAECATVLGIQTWITEQLPEKLGRTLPQVRSAAPSAQYFSKTSFSALGAEGLLKELKDRSVEHVIISGIETPICVYQTALQLLQENIDVTLLTDTLGARRTNDANFVLEALSDGGCHLLPAEAVFYSIIGDAKHPAFKDITNLVKKYHA